LEEIVIERIHEIEKDYYRLFLIIGNLNRGKTNTIREIGLKMCLDPINLNYELCKRLNDFSLKERALSVQTLLEDIIEEQSTPCVLIDNIEILFDQDLQLNPLEALKKISKNKTIVTTWLGDIINKTLYYAEEGYKERFCSNIGHIQYIDLNQQEV